MTITHEPADPAAARPASDRIPAEVRARPAERNGDGGGGRAPPR